MKCLSIMQPWASLVMHGLKTIETRSWSTTHVGPLLIHAGSKATHAQIELRHEEPFRSALAGVGIHRWQDLPLGVVLGTVVLMECRQMFGAGFPGACVRDPKFGQMEDPPTFPERAFGHYECGRYAWDFRDPQRFATPVPYRALQRLFNVPPEAIGFNPERST